MLGRRFYSFLLGYFGLFSGAMFAVSFRGQVSVDGLLKSAQKEPKATWDEKKSQDQQCLS